MGTQHRESTARRRSLAARIHMACPHAVQHHLSDSSVSHPSLCLFTGSIRGTHTRPPPPTQQQVVRRMSLHMKASSPMAPAAARKAAVKPSRPAGIVGVNSGRAQCLRHRSAAGTQDGAAVMPGCGAVAHEGRGSNVGFTKGNAHATPEAAAQQSGPPPPKLCGEQQGPNSSSGSRTAAAAAAAATQGHTGPHAMLKSCSRLKPRTCSIACGGWRAGTCSTSKHGERAWLTGIGNAPMRAP